MDLPLDPGEKYGLVAVQARTQGTGPLDLGGGLWALRGRGLQLPEHWKEWLGTLETELIEDCNLVLLAKSHSSAPSVLDAENEHLINQAKWLFWGLLGAGNLLFSGEGRELSGARDGGEVSVRRHSHAPHYIFRVPGLQLRPVTDTDLHYAASLSRGIGAMMNTPGMRRAKRAVQIFWSAFEETDLGQRIHQFVRVVSEGFTRSFGKSDFLARTGIFVGGRSQIVRRQLYLMRNNAEHFNQPDYKLAPLPKRRALERAHLRAVQAEALARHCVSRFVESPSLWPHFRDDKHIDAFWKQPLKDCARRWGAPLQLEQAAAPFEAQYVRDEV